jgi:hypothetical protein
MYVWSKRLIIGLLAAFGLALGLLLIQDQDGEASVLQQHMMHWIILNYAGLVIWLFVWMIDQTRVRGKNVWIWLIPFLVAPVPTLMALVLFLQRRMTA